MVTEVKLQIGLHDRLRMSAMRTVTRIFDLCQQDSAIAEELRSKFEEAVCDISAVQIEELGPQCGSFFVDKGVLHLSESPIAKLFHEVMEDIRLRQYDPLEPRVDLFELFDTVLGGYVLHELRHRTQGVEHYARVHDIRETAGMMTMAQVDTIADRDAAFAIGALKASGATRGEFLDAFQEALFLSSAYYFRVFPVSAARPDKIARALGVLLMLARLASSRSGNSWVEDNKFPLDAPLYAQIKFDYGSLTVWRGEPRCALLGVCNDQVMINELVEVIESGPIDRALAKCMQLLRAMRVVRS